MISIDWPTKVIAIPQSYLTNLGGGVYELDVDQFRLDLKDLEDSETGMAFPSTHNHNTTVTLSGVTYSRTFEIINGYTVEFENGSYTVSCVGANHNIADVKVVNSVSLLIGNSSGLIQVTSGSGVLPGDITDITNAVWERIIESTYTAEEVMRLLASVSVGKSSGHPTTPVFRDIADTKDRVSGTVDLTGNRTSVTLDET